MLARLRDGTMQGHAREHAVDQYIYDQKMTWVPGSRLVKLERRGYVRRRGKRLSHGCRLMQLYAAQGRRDLVRRQYVKLQELLMRELHVEPLDGAYNMNP